MLSCTDIPDRTPSLADLITIIREAHSGVFFAFSNAIEYALTAGRALDAMEDGKLVRHGQWNKVYKECGLGDRQAERYKRLARLVDANPTFKSEMTGLSIEEAIKKLSPPRAGDGNPSESKTVKVRTPSAPALVAAASHTDILEVWFRLSPAEREHAVNSIGLVAWLDAIPRDWIPRLEQLLTERRQLTAIVPPEPAQAPDDLSIPAFLRREPAHAAE
jgi:hypothetical protein